MSNPRERGLAFEEVLSNELLRILEELETCLRDSRLALNQSRRLHEDAEVQALAPPPGRAVQALIVHQKRQAEEQEAAGQACHETNLVFCHEDGAQYTRDALNLPI
jgi:hypothetical protein